MNNKSRIALAIAAAFGTVAMGASAQTSTVQLGGSFNMFYQKSHPGANNAAGVPNQGKKHDNLSLSEPEMWIHGEEKIGNNTVWFRCTSSFDVFGTSTVTGASAGQLCGRNSALGFKGSFGNVFAGTWDLPQKLVTNEARGWWGGTASLTGGAANLLYNGSASNAPAGVSGSNTFYDRRTRLISYHSPSFSGFSVKAAYTAQNEGTNLTTVSVQNAQSPRIWSASADYQNGPLYVGLGYQRNVDLNPTGQSVGVTATQYNGGSDTNWNIAARYTFGFGTRLSGLYTQSKYETTNTAHLKKNGWAVFVDHKLDGPHSIKGQYYKVGDSKGTLGGPAVGSHAAPGANTGAKGWSLAYMYAMSKRTELGFIYGIIDNESAAAYSKGVSTANVGATQKNYGLNVRHRF